MFATLIALVVASASAQDLRDVRGAAVALDAAPSAVVQWSLDCTSCVAEMRALADDGLRVVAVSSDPAQRRSALVPHLRARGVQAQVVADPTGAVWSRLSTDAAPGERVVFHGLPATATVASR